MSRESWRQNTAQLAMFYTNQEDYTTASYCLAAASAREPAPRTQAPTTRASPANMSVDSAASLHGAQTGRPRADDVWLLLFCAENSAGAVRRSGRASRGEPSDRFRQARNAEARALRSCAIASSSSSLAYDFFSKRRSCCFALLHCGPLVESFSFASGCGRRCENMRPAS